MIVHFRDFDSDRTIAVPIAELTSGCIPFLLDKGSDCWYDMEAILLGGTPTSPPSDPFTGVRRQTVACIAVELSGLTRFRTYDDWERYFRSKRHFDSSLVGWLTVACCVGSLGSTNKAGAYRLALSLLVRGERASRRLLQKEARRLASRGYLFGMSVEDAVEFANFFRDAYPRMARGYRDAMSAEGVFLHWEPRDDS